MNINERIKSLAESKGWSQAKLASESGVSLMTIRRLWNNENYNPTIETIKKVALALGTNQQALIDGKEFEPDDYDGVKGYIDYLGEIKRIDSFKQLEKCYLQIKEDMAIPKEAKKIVRDDETQRSKLSKSAIDISQIDLFKTEKYDTSLIATWDFRKSDDERDEQPNNLGNMCKGYEFDVAGIHFLNSEAAYICGRFSDDTNEHRDIQKELIAESNGYATKKVIRRKYEHLGRKDWESFNIQWMLYVVWHKVSQNKAFSDLLRHIPSNCIIIENSTHQRPQKGSKDTSAFWGAKNDILEGNRDLLEKNAEIQNHSINAKELARLKMQARNSIANYGIWEGVNCMGKILTICKYCIENRTKPPIDYELLRSKKIYLLGDLLTFDDEAEPTKCKR